jgi:hypothetical protein
VRLVEGQGAPERILTRPGVDAERLAYQEK